MLFQNLTNNGKFKDANKFKTTEILKKCIRKIPPNKNQKVALSFSKLTPSALKENEQQIQKHALEFCMQKLGYNEKEAKAEIKNAKNNSTDQQAFIDIINNIYYKTDEKDVSKEDIKNAIRYCEVNLNYDKSTALKLVEIIKQKSTNSIEFKTKLHSIISKEDYIATAGKLKKINYKKENIGNIILNVTKEAKSTADFFKLVDTIPAYNLAVAGYKSNTEAGKYKHLCFETLCNFGCNEMESTSIAAKMQNFYQKSDFENFINAIQSNKYYSAIKDIIVSDTKYKKALIHFKSLGYNHTESVDMIIKAIKSDDFDKTVENAVTLEQLQNGYKNKQDATRQYNICYNILKENGISQSKAKNITNSLLQQFSSKKEFLSIIKKIENNIYSASGVIIVTNDKYIQLYNKIQNLGYAAENAARLTLNMVIEHPDMLDQYKDLLPTKAEVTKGYNTKQEVVDDFYWGLEYLSSLGCLEKEATEKISFLQKQSINRFSFIIDVSINLAKDIYSKKKNLLRHLYSYGFSTIEAEIIFLEAALLFPNDKDKITAKITSYKDKTSYSVKIPNEKQALNLFWQINGTNKNNIDFTYKKMMFTYIKNREANKDRLELMKSYFVLKKVFGK